MNRGKEQSTAAYHYQILPGLTATVKCTEEWENSDEEEEEGLYLDRYQCPEENNSLQVNDTDLQETPPPLRLLDPPYSDSPKFRTPNQSPHPHKEYCSSSSPIFPLRTRELLRLRHVVEDPPETTPHEFQARENSFLALAEEEQKKHLVRQYLKEFFKFSLECGTLALTEENLFRIFPAEMMFPRLVEKYRNEIREEEKQD